MCIERKQEEKINEEYRNKSIAFIFYTNEHTHISRDSWISRKKEQKQKYKKNENKSQQQQHQNSTYQYIM